MDELRATCDVSDAVKVRNCSHEYQSPGRWCRGRSNRHVFDNLDLTVPRGVTYALLGPSGCGKTTLLKCIMGRLQVDSGTIKIFGHQLGLDDKLTGSVVGYMPQETALFSTLTIEETLRYYGKILNLSNARIKSQIHFFISFLKLPSKETINNKLSGGQLRRLSFAVATIHQPRLLILDEPTVGVDPIVRQRMWCYLNYAMKCCSTTIILTTHYLEEARSANVVGLMHHGRMLAEGHPDYLMRVWSVVTLEELFYEVCSNHLEKRTTPHSNDMNQSESVGFTDLTTNDIEEFNLDILTGRQLRDPSESVAVIHSKQSGILRFNRLAAIVMKNFLQFIRIPLAFLFMVILPSIQSGLIHVATSSNISDLNVGVLNADSGPYGSIYLNTLDPNFIQQVQYDSYQDGYQDVVNGKRLAFVYIERNFSETFMGRFIDVDVLKENVLHGGNLNLTIDKTEIMLSSTLIFQLMTTFVNLSNNGSKSSLPNIYLQFHLQPKELIHSSPYVTALPTEIIILMFISQVGTSLMFLFLEKTSCYLERSLVLGITYTEIVFSYIIIQFLICLMQAAGMIMVSFVVFSSPLMGSVGLVMFMAVFSGLVGMAAGLFVSAWLDRLLMIGTIGLSVCLATMGITGLFMPLESSPYLFRFLCACLPFYLPSDALADIMYRNLGLFHVDVIIAIAIMSAWIIGLISMSVVCLRRNVK